MDFKTVHGDNFRVKNLSFFYSIYLCACIFILTYSVSAFADCTSPTGASGAINYDDTTKTTSICDGTNWKTLEVINYSGNGATISVQVGNDFSSCTSAKTGRLRYDSVADTWNYCNGSNWKSFTANADNNLYCWGTNTYGQVGDGTVTTKLIPTLVFSNIAWSKVNADADGCAINSSNNAYCWGLDTTERMGNGGTAGPSRTPYAVSTAFTWKEIDTAPGFTCAIKSDDTAYCWGSGSNGRLGTGNTSNQSSPTIVTGGYTWTKISTGSSHACGIRSNGAAYCWGDGGQGRLGNAASSDSSSPVLVSGGYTWIDISAGTSHTCGVRNDGQGFCWGNNTVNYFLGNGSLGDKDQPYPIGGSLTLTKISSGNAHTCAIDNAGAAYCWGNGANGRLGNGGTSTQSLPVSVNGGIEFSEISAGSDTTCGLSTTGTAYCWGDGSGGGLGSGATSSVSAPVLVASNMEWLTISAGQDLGCAIAAPQ